jgi:peroxiredoxin
MGVSVLAISVDGIFSHAAFKEQNNFQFPLLSDWEKEVIESYGVVWEDLAGMKNVANRSVFVIDKDGTVTYAWRSKDPTNMPPFNEVKEAVKKIK